MLLLMLVWQDTDTGCSWFILGWGSIPCWLVWNLHKSQKYCKMCRTHTSLPATSMKQTQHTRLCNRANYHWLCPLYGTKHQPSIMLCCTVQFGENYLQVSCKSDCVFHHCTLMSVRQCFSCLLSKMYLWLCVNVRFLVCLLCLLAFGV